MKHVILRNVESAFLIGGLAFALPVYAHPTDSAHASDSNHPNIDKYSGYPRHGQQPSRESRRSDAIVKHHALILVLKIMAME